MKAYDTSCGRAWNSRRLPPFSSPDTGLAWPWGRCYTEPVVLRILGLGPWLGLISLVAVGCAIWAVRLGRTGRALASARYAYASASAVLVVYWGTFVRGDAPRPDLVVNGPISDFDVTLLCVAAAWLVLGGLLAVLSHHEGKAWSAEQGARLLASVLLAAQTINVVRERPFFGDVSDYVLAAEQLTRGEPLHARYLYPPLLATLLAPLVKLGPSAVFLFCLAGNLVAVVLTFELLRRALVRYGFAELLAVLVAFCALCANVALLRTLFYVQVNLHITNLMLLSLLAYPQWPLASALALALAAHLKTSPLVVALPFLLNRDYRWLSYFALGILGLVAFTSWANGFQHYREYLENVSNIYHANGIQYRDNSLDSLVRATFAAFGKDIESARPYVLALRGGLFVFALWLSERAARVGLFSAGSGAARTKQSARAYDSFPVLLLLLTTISPLLWEHHPVMMLLSFAVLLKQLDDQVDAVLLLLAYYLVFLIPTFDVYPFSYRITLGAGLAYVLLARTARRALPAGRLFTQLNEAFSQLGTRCTPNR